MGLRPYWVSDWLGVTLSSSRTMDPVGSSLCLRKLRSVFESEEMESNDFSVDIERLS